MTSIKINNWDSELFGLTIGTLENIDKEVFLAIEHLTREKQIDMLQFLSPCDDLVKTRLAEDSGFRFVDIRTTLTKTLSTDSAMPPKLKTELSFRIANENDIPSLLNSSADFYKTTRYYADQHFPREKVKLLYTNWMINAVQGTYDHLCYGLFIQDESIGYCSIRFLDKKIAILGLFGIANAYQGQALSYPLLQSTLADLYERGYTEIRVVTQGKNYAAQRVYQGLGFKTIRNELWYHQWFKPTSNT